MRLPVKSVVLLPLIILTIAGSWLVTGWSVPSVASVAEAEPPARVGRVSVVSGTLAFLGPGDTDWSAAKANLPAAEGGWFATDRRSRAEIRVGAASIDLANETQLELAELRDKVMQIALTQGRLDLHLRLMDKDETTEVDVPRGGVWLLQPGVYDIDSGSPYQPTRIVVFEGSAHFVGGGIDTVVNAGDALVVSGTDVLSARVEPAVPDEFVRWCRTHEFHERRLAAPYHVSPEMTGFEELDAYGEWRAVPSYGGVWFPKAVPADWAPYREGRWVWIEPWGWNWVDDEPWGFAPFHYGRWTRIEDRWAWVPGEFVAAPVYAPALVAFIPPPAIETDVSLPADAGPPVGWFPLAPDEVYWPTYSRDPGYIRNINITSVNVTKITTITNIVAAEPSAVNPPPQIVDQHFVNRTAATVVPARALVASAPVAPAAVRVPPQLLLRAAVSVKLPPIVTPPAAIHAAAPASAAAPESDTAAPPHAPGHGLAAGPGPKAPPPPAGSVAPHPSTAAAAPSHPPALPNFSQLAPAPRVGHTPASAPKAAPASTQANAPAAHQSLPPASAAHADTQPATPAHPPGRPDFGHLPPARVGPPGPNPAQQPVQAAPPPASARIGHATASAPAQSSEPANAHPPAQATAPAAVAHPPGPPDFAHLPPHGVAPQPAHSGPAPSHIAGSAPEPPHRAQAGAVVPPPTAHTPPPARVGASVPAAPDHAAQRPAQQSGAAAAAARQQAEQRAAAAAAARQQAQQRAADEAAARQRAAAEAGARQQAQQRATAGAVARQGAVAAQGRAAAEAAARQQAQQRAAAEAAVRQQAQQRAAAEAAARQQAQQRAAAEAAARQQAQQRAAEAAARQQAAAAQQRAAAEAVARQHAAVAQQRNASPHNSGGRDAQECGHPGQPACPPPR